MASSSASPDRAGLPLKTVEEAHAAIAWWAEAEPADLPRNGGPNGAPVSAACLAQRDAAVDAMRRRIEGLAASYAASGSTKSARKAAAAALAKWHVAVGFAYVPELCSLHQSTAQQRWHLVVLEAETALFYKPRLPDALGLRGIAEAQRMQYAEALTTFTQASACSLTKFQHPGAHSMLAQVTTTMEQRLQAVPGKWALIQAKGEEPPVRFAAGYCQSATELYVFGGDGGQTEGAREAVRSMSKSQARRLLNTLPPEMLAPFKGRDDVDPRDMLLMFPQFIPPHLLHDTWALDLQTLRWRNLQPGNAPSPRQGAALWLWDGALYCHGGEGADGTLGDLHVLELSAGALAWRRLLPKGSPPAARHRHSAFVFAGDSYVWGGRTQRGGDSKLYKLKHDAASGKYIWSVVGGAADRAPPALAQHMWWLDAEAGELVVHGGVPVGQQPADLSGHPLDGALWKCRLASGQWRREKHPQDDEGWLGLTPFDEASCCSRSQRWAHGGYYTRNKRTVVRPSPEQPLRPATALMHSYYYDHLLTHRKGAGWSFVAAAGESPGRRAAAAMAELPGGKGVVVWGGYSTLTEDGRDFATAPRLFPGVYRCLLQEPAAAPPPANSGSATKAESAQGEQAVPPAAAASASPAIQSEDPAVQESRVKLRNIKLGPGEQAILMHNTPTWHEAVRRLVQTDIQLRRAMSHIAWEGFQRSGFGALLIRVPIPPNIPVPREAIDPTKMIYVTRLSAKRHFKGPSRAAGLSVFMDYMELMTAIDTAMCFAVVVMPEEISPTDVAALGMPAEAAWENLSKGHSFGYYGGYGAVPADVMSTANYADANGIEMPASDDAIAKMMNATTYEDMCKLMTVVRSCFNCRKTEVMPDNMLAASGPMATTGKFQACSACKVARYCSRTCQKAHWKEHKKECERLKAESASASAT